MYFKSTFHLRRHLLHANDFHRAEHHSLSPEPPALGAVVGGGPVGRAPLDGRLAPHEGVEPLPDVAHLTAISKKLVEINKAINSDSPVC